MKLEALNTTDGKGGEGQSEHLGGGVHEMKGGGEVDHAVCLCFKGALSSAKSVRDDRPP